MRIAFKTFGCRANTNDTDALLLEAQRQGFHTVGDQEPADAFIINTWNHIALAYTDDGDDDITVYVNGIARGTADGSGAPATTDTNNLLIGGSSTANFDGQIDDFRVYNYELTAKQVQTMMNDGAIRRGPVTGAP